ncbi:hypothetical protein BCR39DRAFT_286297 [Naematelia encephala]|uniref:Zn(2)-C6 fungal-type domain-containing protein n=1 Tax=Naematelia encephala TaxID=71784 RepID=A0A1Y2ATL7_9TREE|nr:hypothetical protein BCR39DRAFT_286297 [Naematelia encephala]
MPGCWTCRKRKVKCRDFLSTSESPSGSHSSTDDSCPNCRRLKLHCIRTKPSTSEEESDAAVRGWKPLRKRSGVLSKINHGSETNGSPLDCNRPRSTGTGDDVFCVRDPRSRQDNLTTGGGAAESQATYSSNTGMQSTPPTLDLGMDAMSSQSNIFAAVPLSSGTNSLFPWDTGQTATSSFDIVDPWTITTVSAAGHGNSSTGNGQLYVVDEEDEGSALLSQYPSTNDCGPERTWYKSLVDVIYPDQDLIAHYLVSRLIFCMSLLSCYL